MTEEERKQYHSEERIITGKQFEECARDIAFDEMNCWLRAMQSIHEEDMGNDELTVFITSLTERAMEFGSIVYLHYDAFLKEQKVNKQLETILGTNREV